MRRTTQQQRRVFPSELPLLNSLIAINYNLGLNNHNHFMPHFNRRTVNTVFKKVQKIIDYIQNLEQMKQSLMLALLICCTFSGKPGETTETDFYAQVLGSSGSLSKSSGSLKSSGNIFKGSLRSLFGSKGSDIGSSSQNSNKKKKKKERKNKDQYGNPISTDEGKKKQIEESLQDLSKALANLQNGWGKFKEHYPRVGNSMKRPVGASGYGQMKRLQRILSGVNEAIEDLSGQVLGCTLLSTSYKQLVQEQVGNYVIICGKLAASFGAQAQHLELISTGQQPQLVALPKPKFMRVNSKIPTNVVMKFECRQSNPNEDQLANKMSQLQQIIIYLTQVFEKIEESFEIRQQFPEQLNQEILQRMKQVQGVIRALQMIKQGVNLYSEETKVRIQNVVKAETHAQDLFRKLVSMRAKNQNSQSSLKMLRQGLLGGYGPLLGMPIPSPKPFQPPNGPSSYPIKGTPV